MAIDKAYYHDNNKKGFDSKPLYLQKVQGDELEALKQRIVENAHAYTFDLSITQIDVEMTKIGKNGDTFQKEVEAFEDFLENIGYEGKKIADLTQEEAKELVSEEGFFGIKKTARRIADFVIKGANGNGDLLKAGLEGIVKGFEEAERIWGSKLPDISYKTIEKAKSLIQEEMKSKGVGILDTKV